MKRWTSCQPNYWLRRWKVTCRMVILNLSGCWTACEGLGICFWWQLHWLKAFFVDGRNCTPLSPSKNSKCPTLRGSGSVLSLQAQGCLLNFICTSDHHHQMSSRSWTLNSLKVVFLFFFFVLFSFMWMLLSQESKSRISGKRHLANICLLPDELTNPVN